MQYKGYMKHVLQDASPKLKLIQKEASFPSNPPHFSMQSRGIDAEIHVIVEPEAKITHSRNLSEVCTVQETTWLPRGYLTCVRKHLLKINRYSTTNALLLHGGRLMYTLKW